MGVPILLERFCTTCPSSSACLGKSMPNLVRADAASYRENLSAGVKAYAREHGKNADLARILNADLARILEVSRTVG